MSLVRSLLTDSFESLLTFSRRTSRTALSLARIGQWTALAAILLASFGMARPAAAQTNLIHVTTTTPGNSNGGCSLQEAIYSANFDQAIAIGTVNPDTFYNTGCEPGNGTDTIVLPANSVFQMTSVVDDAHNQYGPTATPVIFTTIIIEAYGSRLELVPGSPNMRAFSVGFGSVDLNPGGTPNVVSGYGNLTVRNAHIKGFTVKGGNGAGGGGGSMGAGGAIYLNGGGLTVENSTFEGNGATGGNGSTLAGPDEGISGGGGGGLAGNGGSASTSGGGGGGSRGNGGNGGSGSAGGG